MRRMSTMRAVVIGVDGRAGLQTVPTPTPADGELLVRVTAVGLCGSDVEKLGDPELAGAILGHEIAGVVEAGPLPAGTRVTIAHRVPCGSCGRCRSGHETTCPEFLASSLRPGGFAEVLVASTRHVADAVQVLPEQVSDVAATFVEPLGCVLRGIASVPAGRGAVVGCGAVGLLVLRALKQRGDTVVVADPDGARRGGALAGADGVAAAGDELDYAVVTAPGGLNEALGLVRPGGTILAFAAPSGAVPFLLDSLYRRELRLLGSRSAGPAALRDALRLIAAGHVAVEDLATDVLPLSAFAEGLARYRSRRALKVVFRP
jgi:L-iditol 2-dehydrogenase